MLDKEYELFCTKADEELTRTISKMFSIYTVLKDTEITYLSHSMAKQMNPNDKYTLAIFLAGLSVNDDITCFFKDNNITMKIVTDSFKISLDNLEELNKDEFKELFIDSYKFLKRISEPLSLEDTTSKILVANALYDYCTNSDVINCLFKKNDLNLEMVRNNFTEFIGSPSMNDNFKTPIDNSFISKVSSDLKEFGDYLSINKDDIVGRDREVRRLEASLISPGRAILIGEAGVGKTAIVEELARQIVNDNVPRSLKGKVILSLSMASLVAGTKYRGEFEERVGKILKEIEEHDEYLIFIDEIHTLVGAGGAEGAIDASNILKPALARGKIHLIGATTVAEYREFIEKDKALNRRFQIILVEEPNKDKTKEILKKLKPLYEAYHSVSISDEMIDMIVELSNTYIYDYYQPDKAIDILDEVCSRASLVEDKKDKELKRLNDSLKKVVTEKKKAVLEQNFKKPII